MGEKRQTLGFEVIVGGILVVGIGGESCDAVEFVNGAVVAVGADRGQVTIPPEARPYRASKPLVMTLYSGTPSRGICWPVLALKRLTFSTPSSRTRCAGRTSAGKEDTNAVIG